MSSDAKVYMTGPESFQWVGWHFASGGECWHRDQSELPELLREIEECDKQSWGEPPRGGTGLHWHFYRLTGDRICLRGDRNFVSASDDCWIKEKETE